MLNIAQRTKTAREALGLSKIAFAEKMMYDRNYVARVEKGDQEPGPRYVRQLEALEREIGRGVVSKDDVQESAHSSVLHSAHKKLISAMESAGMTAEGLAQAIGYPIEAVQAVVNQGSRITRTMAQRIAEVLPQLTAEDLAGPKIIKEGTLVTFEGYTVTLPKGERAHMVPVLSWTQAGAMNDYLKGAWEGEVVLAMNAPFGETYGLRVRGDSMVPEIREGDIVIVTSAREPKTGEVVIAKRVTGDVMCKLYTPTDGGRRVLLTSYNKAHPDIALDLSELVFIHPVLTVMRNLAQT